MQDHTYSDSAVLIPAYQPGEKLAPYASALLEAGYGHVVVVDDGSGAAYDEVFSTLPQDGRLTLLRYPKNGGKGVALRTGLEYLRDHCPDAKIILTADSDGQHTVPDTLRMADRLHEDGEGLLLGSRNFKQDDVPFKSRMGNRITTVVFAMLYGRWIPDTQTGLRGFTRELLPRMIGVKGNRYEYEMNVLIDVALGKIPIKTLTIETVYENNNEGSHFRPLRDSARIYKCLFSGFIKFVAASLTCFVVDYLLFLLLNMLFRDCVPALSRHWSLGFLDMVGYVALATILARIVSGSLNFILNKRVVFEDGSSLRRTIPRYLCVFFLNMLLSALFTSTLHIAGMAESGAKIVVDTVLFFLGYFLQRKWVFSKKGTDKTLKA